MGMNSGVEVVINNKLYTICATEGEEYIRKVASYVNDKQEELKQMPGYDRLNLDYRTVLSQINIADDYFKIDEKYIKCLEENKKNSKEIENLTKELIDIQKQNDELEKDASSAKKDLSDAYEEIDSLREEINSLKNELYELNELKIQTSSF